LTLAIVYWVMTIGCFFMVFGGKSSRLSVGFCLTDVSSYVYYSFYAILLYRLLLSSVIGGDSDVEADGMGSMGEAGRARYRPLIDDEGSDDELLNLGDQF